MLEKWAILVSGLEDREDGVPETMPCVNFAREIKAVDLSVRKSHWRQRKRPRFGSRGATISRTPLTFVLLLNPR